MDDPEPDDGLVDTPLVSHFLDSEDDSDDGEVLNELEEYGRKAHLLEEKQIPSVGVFDEVSLYTLFR
ncbi:hypothetical protein Tco_0746577, partial [Tanacetum coccineum]